MFLVITLRMLPIRTAIVAIFIGGLLFLSCLGGLQILLSTPSSPRSQYNAPPLSAFRCIPPQLSFSSIEQSKFKNFFLSADTVRKYSECSESISNFLEDFSIGNYEDFVLCSHKIEKLKDQQLMDLYKGSQHAE